MPLIYVDSSSLVKLIRREPETDAMYALLAERPQVASSALSGVEVSRAVRRAGVGEAAVRRVGEVLSRVTLMAVDDPVLERAAEIGQQSLGSLDAIHLASALSLQPELDLFVCHDRRLAHAAHRAGLPVSVPGPSAR